MDINIKTKFYKKELFYVTDDRIQCIEFSLPTNEGDKLNDVYRAVKAKIRKYTNLRYLEVSKFSPNGLGKVLNRNYLKLDRNDPTSDIETLVATAFKYNNYESPEGLSGGNFNFNGRYFESSTQLLIYLYDLILRRDKFIKRINDCDLYIDSIRNPLAKYIIPDSYIIGIVLLNYRLGKLKDFDGYNFEVLEIPTLKSLRKNKLKLEKLTDENYFYNFSADNKYYYEVNNEIADN